MFFFIYNDTNKCSNISLLFLAFYLTDGTGMDGVV